MPDRWRGRLPGRRRTAGLQSAETEWRFGTRNPVRVRSTGTRGKDLRKEPIERRKLALEKILRSAPDGIALSEHAEGDAATIFRHACQLGYEGIVSKLKGSRYRSGRSRDWIKTKNPKHPATTRVLEEDWS
jgi:hypothetical protein